LHLWLIFCPNYCIRTFDLMIALAANKLFMRSKFKIKHYLAILISWSKCRPPDQNWKIFLLNFDLMNKFNFDLMKKWISISWNFTSWSISIRLNKIESLEFNHFLYTPFEARWDVWKELFWQCELSKVICLAW